MPESGEPQPAEAGAAGEWECRVACGPERHGHGTPVTHTARVRRPPRAHRANRAQGGGARAHPDPMPDYIPRAGECRVSCGAEARFRVAGFRDLHRRVGD